MFRRFHEMRERDESGFTLIELLVVILIIAILAAIAIPVFLKQREKGWDAQTQSALKNAATAEESWLTEPSSVNAAGGYTTDESQLATNEGFKKADKVSALTITVSGGEKYCISATNTNFSASDQGAHTWAVSSDDSTPTLGTCAAGGVKA